ncbi:MAG TPA: alpha/beta hydrolase [Allosphingosinicella sp.]|nr:alpha/beta hydrolase [Allosphingosinicella sp.]
MVSWNHGYWMSDDGLRLHYRDYPGPSDGLNGRPPIICIPGLTRNARDFEAVAERLSAQWRLLCIDLRGRGESGYARNPMSYVPTVYLGDLETLFAELGLNRMILFGTSLGGIVAMLLALRDRSRIAAVLLNDIGPDIDPEGLERIRAVVGRSQSWPTWVHAARHFAATQGVVHPKWKLDQWLAHAKRLCRLNANGRIILDYDMRIAEPFRAAGDEPPAFDMWTAFAALNGIASLTVRGALSDILSAQTLERMKAENATMEDVTIPNVGHAPTLEEPQAAAAIDRLLARVA